MIDKANLIRHGERNQIAEADKDEDHSEEGERRALHLETSGQGHSHAVAHHEYECLLIDRAWAGEEEVAKGKVKEGYGSNNGLGGYESHDCGLVSIQVEVGYRFRLCRVVASQGRREEKQAKS